MTESLPVVAMPLSRAICPSLEWREQSASTNTELVANAPQLPDLAVIATDNQTAGRGRLDRVWSAAPGAALAVSVLVRHDASGNVEPRLLGWLPLLAGVAMTRAVRSLGADSIGLKWPNDVLAVTSEGERKLSGILTELTTDGVVIGAGLNLTMSHADLPVPTATSLALMGVPTDAALTDRALAAYLRELTALVAQWRATPQTRALAAIVEPELHTLGRAVRIDRPGLPVLLGTAVGLDDDGRLLVRSADAIDPVIAVAAGDVTHLRYE
ncbi:biotin--[acetyl-CoA-carboxylase] ligase [Microcella sp.]|uniref:biotin--[acetyl-CoA-carboxylase] ligase n=1 Tax=Microcella sp. TaxID=1913979 RepID=UPI00299F5344|nr:biotin--[acetyl-CoA-carboxylase] ligase [Microcella sp.]MDX2025119.1 biotin--[acetyl-CoA-carboxylase] ligase [Microcella sp.]